MTSADAEGHDTGSSSAPQVQSHSLCTVLLLESIVTHQQCIVVEQMHAGLSRWRSDRVLGSRSLFASAEL